MIPSIIVSNVDEAGLNIKKMLIKHQGFKHTGKFFDGHKIYVKEYDKNQVFLYTINDSTIHANGIDNNIKGDFIIFATKHQAASEKKCFCVHPPGNWGIAEAGGSDFFLCNTIPTFMKTALIVLNTKVNNSNLKDEFEVTMEATHHGPKIDKPCFFIEIGSSLVEWNREDTGSLMSDVINELIPIFYDQNNQDEKLKKNIIVFGGGHYNQTATKLMFNTGYSVGHICPKYAIDFISPELISQAFSKSQANLIVLDWKGLGSGKDRLIKFIQDLDLPYERYQRLKKQ